MQPDEHAPAQISSDGMWWWDGEVWRPTDVQSSVRPSTSSLGFRENVLKSMMTGESRLALRVCLYGLVAALIIYALLSADLRHLDAVDAQLVTQTSLQQRQIDQLNGQVNQLQATVDDLRQRWIGDPPLWQPSGVPSNTTIEYFDVIGTTQADLINALNNDGLCAKYGCAPDPAVPNNNVAWAQEQDSSTVEPSAPYCYTPRTISYHFTGHTVRMPRWSPKPGTAKITVVQKWNALEGVMLTHELGHVKVSEDYLSSLNAQSQHLASCQAMNAFWQNSHIWDGLAGAQNAYHAKLRADCRPEVGCIPPGWMGW